MNVPNWKIQFDPVALFHSFQQSGAGMKTDDLPNWYNFGLPEDVRRRQRCMAAQFHFRSRSKPAQIDQATNAAVCQSSQIEIIAIFQKKSSFREVHLSSHCLHPIIRERFGQKTYSCRVPFERLVSE